jgi:hypothetical protein
MSRSKWYYDHDGQTGGPVSVSQLRQLAANGELRPTDRIRKEDMDRWVKARAVKGLFTNEEPSSLEPTGRDATFDFFGVGPPQTASEPANEFHPAFDFFGGPSAPVPESKPVRKSKHDAPAAEVPAAAPAPPPTVDDSGSFQLTVPMAAPAESRDEEPVPYADFQADVPMAMPASAIGLPAPPVSAELTGPEVAGQPDGTARPTGALVELSVTGGWLLARSAGPDGNTGETYLRLRRLTAVAMHDRPGAGLVLSFHAGPESVAVQCEGDATAARAFLRRVLEAAG